MDTYVLDEEEQEILDAFESGKMESIPHVAEEISRHRQYAAETLSQIEDVNVRIANRDLMEIQKLALQEGIPYQNLIESVLHKFANGRYMEKTVFS